jgi:hypothetical protein
MKSVVQIQRQGKVKDVNLLGVEKLLVLLSPVLDRYT